MENFEGDSVSPEVLQQYAENAFSKTYIRSKNPFQLPCECEIFGYKEFEKKRIQNERESIRRMSLIQRADLQKPKVPTCILSSTLITSRNMQSKSSLSTTTILQQKRESDQQRSMRVTEFIQQKREIYIIQLLIDKKNQEIKQIYNRMETSEKNLIQREQQIEVDTEKIKLANTHNEMKLARAKRHMEDEISKKVELQRKLRNVTNNVFMLNSEISKNEDMLQSYQSYEEFLQKLTPEDEKIFEYFNSPEVLIKELHTIERDNLTLIQNCQHFESLVEKGVSSLKKKDDEALERINEIKNQLDNLEVVDTFPDELYPAAAKSFDVKSQEIKNLSEIIERIYINCFGATADVTPVVMLQRINIKLEDFYDKMDLIDPDYALNKQAIKDKQRREQQRREKQEKQEAEQKIKMELTLARANRPIKKKNGRPLYGRGVIKKNEKKTDLKMLRELKEKKETEKLLYGEKSDEL